MRMLGMGVELEPAEDSKLESSKYLRFLEI
jgi:hypothetical protein